MSSQTTIASTSRAPGVEAKVWEVNDSLVNLHQPPGVASVQVLFFHGLPSGNHPDVHLSTWKCGDGSSHLWPNTWLVEEFPGAQVFSVRYSQGLLDKGSLKTFDMKNVRENLLSDLIQGNIGQVRGCPVVLVGHCIGGLVIKQVCMEAHQKLCLSQNSNQKADLENFLNRMSGIVYYATPHHGIPHISKAKDLVSSPLLKYFETLSTVAERENSDFDSLCKIYSRWQTKGLGESLPVDVGVFQGIVVVPEASAREGVLNVDTADHFSICKPPSKTSRRCNALAQLLHNSVSYAKEDTRPTNFQHISHQVQGIDIPLQEVKGKLKDTKSLCLIGMGGLGKTTLAKVVFNDMASQFQYTCFVPDVKLIGGGVNDLKKEVWKYLYHDGKKVDGECDWSKLHGKYILVVLDDISTDRDVSVLSEIAEGPSLESCYIATSRQQDILDDTYKVPFLNEDYGERVFMSFAFPNQVAPPAILGSLVREVVKKCDGLPLTLEVLGKWLKRTRKREDWIQALHALGDAEDVAGFNERLWKKLRLSYDGLEEKEKEMFLDAVTFFRASRFCQWTLREAKVAWKEAYQLNCENLLWQTLVDRFLVYDVDEDQPIKLHEQLQSLGQKIALESQDRCRLSLALEDWHLLPSTHPSKNQDIHALQLQVNAKYNGDRDFRSTHLKNLRYLQFVNDRLIVPPRHPNWIVRLFYRRQVGLLHLVGPDSLVVLAAGSLCDPTRQSHLAILKLVLYRKHSLPKSIGRLSRLRIFYLEARELRSLPDEIGQLSLLEELKLDWCHELETLPETFGQLSNLKKLVLINCDSLSSLPQSFGNLSALEHLTVTGCSLRTLPESFGQLPSLSHLEVRGCGEFHFLPDSFGALRALAEFRFTYCRELKELPDSFGQLPALRHLEVVHCGLRSLPESIGNILTLSHLEIDGCEHIHSLPGSVGQMVNLENFKIRDCPLETLPDSLGELENLRDLIIHDCPLEALPYSLAELKNLRSLVMFQTRMQSIPEFIQNLPSLQTLDLEILPVTELPPWLGYTGPNGLSLSRKTFRIEHRRFSLTQDEYRPRGWHTAHRAALWRVQTPDYAGALAELACPAAGCPHDSLEAAFFLQEKGIVKQMMGDLPGALEDLTSALNHLSEVGDQYTYDCWKHRGYVNFLMGNRESAEKDAQMALKLEYNCVPLALFLGFRISLGREQVTYMHFKFKTSEEVWRHQFGGIDSY